MFSALSTMRHHQSWRAGRQRVSSSNRMPAGSTRMGAALLEPPLEAALAEFGLVLWEFDMLATLRRAGHPYRLSPTELFFSLMVTSGTMTHRLKRLEARGLIERLPNAEDARSMLVQLTPSGVALINRAVDVFVEHERRILSVLPEEVLVDLDENLARLLLTLEGGQGEAGPGMA